MSGQTVDRREGNQVKMSKTISWAIAGVMLAVSFSAFADHDDWRWRGGGRWREGWHRDWGFRGPDMDRWRGGYWVHGDHDGRLGWWWVVAGLWYFYPQPVYPYPEPYAPLYYPPVQPELPIPAPPPVQYWYYCNAAKAYYPYVQTCPGGWVRVPATPSAPNQ